MNGQTSALKPTPHKLFPAVNGGNDIEKTVCTVWMQQCSITQQRTSRKHHKLGPRRQFFIYILKAFKSVATGQIQQCLTNHGDHPPEEQDRHQTETVPCPCRPSTQSSLRLIFKIHKVGSLINVNCIIINYIVIYL